jgi:hypothetical protein
MNEPGFIWALMGWQQGVASGEKRKARAGARNVKKERRDSKRCTRRSEDEGLLVFGHGYSDGEELRAFARGEVLQLGMLGAMQVHDAEGSVHLEPPLAEIVGFETEPLHGLDGV